MKKMVLGTLLFFSIVAMAGKDSLVAKGLKFVAPAISDIASVAFPEAGEIVYQSTDGQFYGHDGAAWNKLSAGESIFPSGVILPYGGTSAPSGFLAADGAAYLIADHPELHAAIQTAFGDGTKNADGSSSGYAPGTAFNVPDMRGRFLRGVSGSSNVDPEKNSRSSMISGGNGNTNNNVGSVQGHQFGSHSHGFSFGTANMLFASTYQTQAGPSSWTGSGWSTSSAGGTETRPVNIYVNYIIKR